MALSQRRSIDDIAYVRDLGLVKADSWEIANPLYQQITPRALTKDLFLINLPDILKAEETQQLILQKLHRLDLIIEDIEISNLVGKGRHEPRKMATIRVGLAYVRK